MSFQGSAIKKKVFYTLGLAILIFIFSLLLTHLFVFEKISIFQLNDFFNHMGNEYYRKIFSNIFYLSVTISLLIFIASYKKKPTYIKNLHGSAHWASKKEIERTGLLNNQGVYVGAWEDSKKRVKYLRHNGPEHIIAFAPTRSGKGIGLVIPTLLSWGESALILDIKGENYALTAGYRKAIGQKVLKFDPADPSGAGARFNPLEEIRLETLHEVQDVQNIVNMIVDPDGKGLNDHWAKTGSALLIGTILHCLYEDRKKRRVSTLADVGNILSDPSSTIESTMNLMLNTKHLGDTVHPVVANSAREMLNKAPNEASGVLSTALSFLTLYRDPIVAKNIEKSDFSIKDLMNHEKPVSLYIILPPSDNDRMKPLTRLLINLIVRRLTSEKLKFENGRPKKHYKHKLLLVMDEFPSLGKLEIFQQSLAFIAGYGLKAYIIVQDLAQLYSEYTTYESIVSNCHIRIAFAPNKNNTAEEISRMLGVKTEIKDNISISGKRNSLFLNNVTRSFQEIRRPLLTADEVSRLKSPEKDSNSNIVSAGETIVMVSGSAPIFGRHILFFQDQYFLKASQIEPPEISDVLNLENIFGEQKYDNQKNPFNFNTDNVHFDFHDGKKKSIPL